MKIDVRHAVALGLLGVSQLAAAQDISSRALLQKIPPIPESPQAAYAQWHDADAVLTPGPELEAIDRIGRGGGDDQAQAAMTSPDIQSQMALAQQMQQRYGSPQGQARLQNMSPAQLMALARAYQAPTAAPTTISSHDRALVARMNQRTDPAQTEQAIQRMRGQTIAIQQKWQSQEAVIDAAQGRELAALPLDCHPGGDIAIVAPAKTRAVLMRYADQRVQLADRSLRDATAIEQALRAAFGPEVDREDSVSAAWAQLADPALKQRLEGLARSARGEGFADVTFIWNFVEGTSKHAAQAIADRKKVQRDYAGKIC